MPNDPSIQSLINFTSYVSYAWDYGLRGIPVCGPPGTPLSIVAEHAPTCHKIVNWLAQAQDLLPGADVSQFCPDWKVNNSNEVLVAKAMSAPFKIDLGDGTTLSTIAGVYVYLLLVPPADTDQLASSIPPWNSALQQIIYPNQFLQSLLDSSGTVPNPGGGYAGMPGQNVPSSTKPPQPQNVDMMQFFVKPIPP